MKLQEMISKRREMTGRMGEIAAAADGEKREFTAEEKAELEKLRREAEVLGVQIAAYSMDSPEARKVEREIRIEEAIREAVTSRKGLDVALRREAGVQELASVQDSLVPLTINDVLQPLEMGLIYDKVGIRLQTGLAGDYVWPVLGSVEAEVAGESIALSDQTLDLSEVKPTPRRVGISIKVSYQTVTQTRGVILDLIRQQMPLAVARTLNRMLFSHEKFTGDLYGPFKDAEVTAGFAGQVPTYAELLAMKGQVYGKGITGGTFCYVMTEGMKATLEATPRDAGSGLMIVENDRIAGYPVFCTEFINYGAASETASGSGLYTGKNATKSTEEYIGAGVWAYEVLGQFGDFRFVTDPYSLASKDQVKFTLNSDWSATCLRKEAFVLKKCAARAEG